MRKSIFVLKDQPQLAKGFYGIDRDLKEGFKEARRNSQVMLALEYMEKILDVLDANLTTDDDPIAELEQDEEPTPEPAATSTAKSKRTASAAKSDES